MKKIYSSAIFVFLLVVVVNCLAQTPVDSVITRPTGYTLSQLRPVNGLTIDAADNKWVAFEKIGLGKLNASGWTMYDSTNSGLPTDTILCVACNSSGLWAGTNKGLYNFNGTTWRSFTTSNSNIPNDTVLKLYSPTTGNELWIISNHGFVYFDGVSFHPYNTGNSGLINDTVQCMFKSTNGLWWIGTVHGLSSFDGTTWQNYSVSNSGLCDDNITALVEDGNNYLFTGTRHSGLFKKSGNNFIELSIDIRNAILFLFKLSNGNILLATDYGQYFIATNPDSINAKWKNFFSYSCTDTTAYYTIDPLDRIWRVKKGIYNSSFNMYVSDSLTYNSNVTIATSSSFLDINQVKCQIWNDNSFFWDKMGSPQYKVPAQSCGKNSIFAGALWIEGLDTSGRIHVSAQLYNQNGNDFWPGPLDTLNATIDSITKMRYDSIWKIDRQTINTFILEFNLGNVTNHSYTVPNIILNWPAHGTGNYSRDLAPFVDHNGDGIYNPYDGDYPDIKGDLMLWWVMNDNFSVHSATFGNTMGLEIQGKAYAYSCPNVSANDEAVNYTTFYSYNIINRSNSDYDSVYIGIFTDVDLGNYLDDFVGCRIDGDYGFVYNGDNYDDLPTGYGANPPMLSVALLKGPLADLNDGLDNNHNGVIDEPGENCMMNHFLSYNNNSSVTGNPNTANDYYCYLRSIWKDGRHVTYGGDGRGGLCGGTIDSVDYMYSGMPYDTGWTETSNCAVKGDRIFLISTGPFTLKAHHSKTLDYAIVYSRDENNPNGLTTSVAKNDHDVRMVKHWFDTDSFPCNNNYVGIKEAANKSGFSLYPNPSQEKFYITVQSKEALLKLELTDVTGRDVIRQNIFSNRSNAISTQGIAAGIYFVKVSGKDVVLTKKLIVD